jgi:hypothetical protein
MGMSSCKIHREVVCYPCFIPLMENKVGLAGRSVRELASAAQSGCLECLQVIPQQIKLFFSHRYADFRLFFRAFASMARGIDLAMINRRIEQLRNFLALLSNPQCSREQVVQRFADLTDVHSLFFYVDQNYVQRLATSQDEAAEAIRQEMIRECQRAISYQLALITVCSLYFRLVGKTTPVGAQAYTPDSATIQNSPARTISDPRWDWFDQLVAGQPINFDNGTVAGLSMRMSVQHTPTMRQNHVVQGIRLDIPETVQCSIPLLPPSINNYYWQEYRRRHSDSTIYSPNPALPSIFKFAKCKLPLLVLQNAREIASLKANYVADDRFPIHHFIDPIYGEIMEIPVIDASHPQIQNSLSNTNDQSLNRSARHPMDLESILEMRLIRATQRLAVKRRFPVCPECRHPQNEGRPINPRHLLVDYALQIEILDFLRAREGTRVVNQNY